MVVSIRIIGPEAAKNDRILKKILLSRRFLQEIPSVAKITGLRLIPTVLCPKETKVSQFAVYYTQYTAAAGVSCRRFRNE